LAAEPEPPGGPVTRSDNARVFRRWLWPVLVAIMLSGAGCSANVKDQPAALPFNAVELPAGARPVALSAAGDALLIGVRREGQPVLPGLLRRGPDGALTEVAVHAASEYGRLATWGSIAADGERLVAVGGERGGAHGHVRWSVWTGSLSGTPALAERVQGFSTFGGYEMGELVDAVLTPGGAALVGSWQSAKLGFDVAVWTPEGDVWTRQNSVGTALESTPDVMGFPTAAATLRAGILVVGWQLALNQGGRQEPVVWRSTVFNSGWTRAALPDAGKAGAAMAVRCGDATCAAAGRVDGKLAVWHLDNGGWRRMTGEPAVTVGDLDTLAAPIEIGGQLTQVVSDAGHVKIARAGGDGWTVRPVTGPTGKVTAVTLIGESVYLLAGPDELSQTLWRAEAGALH
jgi:hypothetical protein